MVAAKDRGYAQYGWGMPPSDAGWYNSFLSKKRFLISSGIGYDSHYGRFFRLWYSGVLLNHADRVLSKVYGTFGDTPIAVKVSV